MSKRWKKGTKGLNLCRNEDTFLPPLGLNYKHLQECIQDKKKNFQSNNNKQTNNIDSYTHQSLKYGKGLYRKKNIQNSTDNNHSYHKNYRNVQPCSKLMLKPHKIKQYCNLTEPIYWRLREKGFASNIGEKSRFSGTFSNRHSLKFPKINSSDKFENLTTSHLITKCSDQDESNFDE